MQYRSYIKFVPKGTSPRDASQMKSIEVKTNSRSRGDIVSKSYRTSNNPYSLRNHWEIFEIEIEFDNPPWDHHHELCAKLLSYDMAKAWKAVEEFLYVNVESGKESDYISKIESYHKGLNPIKSSDDFVRVTVDPTVE